MKHTFMKYLTTRILLAACLLGSAASRLSAQEPASPDPYAHETPAQRDARMQWWREAKFGMFIHWGVYAVPAGVYKDKKGGAEWIMHVAGIPKAEYQGFAKQFNPIKYDADAWVRLAKEAGMQYIVLTSKHHDGFALFDSKASDWNVVKATPYGKDLLKPLAEACRKHGIKLGFYYSQAQDWCNKTSNMDDYLRDVAVPQVRELLANYGPDTPAILWWDTPYDMTAKRGEPFLELLKLKPGILHNNRLVQPEVGGDFSTPEREIPATGLKDRDWETCMTMNDNWGYVSYDNSWKSAESLVRNLIDTASKGGNYLLNVGPTAEGEFPQASVERLRGIGQWMKVNGEAIYGTQASPFKKLSFNGRCTLLRQGDRGQAAKASKLFLHLFARPAGGTITLPMANKITKAYLLADPNTALQVADKTITLPDALPDPIATVVVAEIQGAPDVGDGAIGQAADGSVTLRAADADITGAARLVDQGGTPNIGFWMDASDTVQWPVNITRPGSFNVELTLACNPGSENSEYELIAGEAKLTGKVAATKDWNDYTTVKVGALRIPQAGKLTLSIKPLSKPGQGVMNLRQVKLAPHDG